MKLPLSILATVFLLAVVLSSPCRAMSVIPPSFSKLVHNADQIVRAQAVSASSRWDATSQGGRVIHTYVQFQVMATLKGAEQASVTLRFLGGQVGNDGMVIPDMPSFQIGSTYILFVAANGSAFCPLVGIQHGSYQVVADAATGTERIARSNGTPLKAAADVGLPIEPRATRILSVDGAITRPEFEGAILQELGHARTR
jgi:hypothetical protein